MKTRTAEISLLLVAALWGGGFIFTHGALAAGINPMWITAFRFVIAGILFYCIAHRRLKGLSELLVPGLVLGFFLGSAFILQTFGLRYTTPSRNAFFTATNVVFTPFICFFLTKNVIRMRIVFSVLLVSIGIAFLTLDEVSRLNKGDVLTLICAVLFAFHIYFIGYYVRDRKLDIAKIVFLQFGFAAVVSGLAALIFEPFIIPSLSGFTHILYLAIFSTLLGFLIQNTVQRFVTQTKTALILSMEAAFGTVFSVIFVHETLTLVILTGFVFMAAGIVLAET